MFESAWTVLSYDPQNQTLDGWPGLKILAAPLSYRTTVAYAPAILLSLSQQPRLLQTHLSDDNYVWITPFSRMQRASASTCHDSVQPVQAGSANTCINTDRAAGVTAFPHTSGTIDTAEGTRG